MDKYEISLKIKEIQQFVKLKQYKKALKILDTINISKLKITNEILVIVEVYIQNARYEEALELLQALYDKCPTRRVLYQLIDVLIKKKDFDDAKQYLGKYKKMAPKDPNGIILSYRLNKASGESVYKLIACLEELKQHEYVEEWAYELAKLYHKAGYREKCINECSEIKLWFGEGIIVEKATLLKGHYMGVKEPITPLKATSRKKVEEEDQIAKTRDISRSVKEVLEQIEQEKEKTDTILLEEEKANPKLLQEEENQTSLEPQEEVMVTEEHKEIKDIQQKIKELNIEKILYKGIDRTKQIPVIQCSFEDILEKKSLPNFIFMDIPSVEVLDYAKKISKCLNSLGILKTKQIARISAYKLNQVELEEAWDSLADSCVLIEQASHITKKTEKELHRLIDYYKGSIAVLLEDTKGGIEQLMKSNKLKYEFQHVIYFREEDET